MSHITTLPSTLVSTDTIIPSNDKMAKIYLTGPGYEINFVPHIILALFSYQGKITFSMTLTDNIK